MSADITADASLFQALKGIPQVDVARNLRAEPLIHRAVAKIATGNNPADNYWRAGNMLGAIDLEAGRITRTVRGTGADLTANENHPGTNRPIVGAVIPDWEWLTALVSEAAKVFAGIRTQSWDVALTDQGPVLLEVNFGGDLNLHQLDGYLVALDADTGKPVWKTKVVDYKDGETNTSPPLIVKNMAIVGFSSGEYGARGALQAFDLASGKQLWKTWTIPGRGEPGNDGLAVSWRRLNRDGGGDLLRWRQCGKRRRGAGGETVLGL